MALGASGPGPPLLAASGAEARGWQRCLGQLGRGLGGCPHHNPSGPKHHSWAHGPFVSEFVSFFGDEADVFGDKMHVLGDKVDYF